MKKLLFLILIFCFSVGGSEALAQGKVVSFVLNSKALQNTGGEDPNRKVSVYLPPNYDASTQRYPVIYYLHGFMGKDNIFPQMQAILDEGIKRNKIKPFIFVQADQYTLYEGSFYSNSSLTGNWDEFESKELVEYVDKNYRTLATRESRGVAGHSMGGYGAFKIGMLHPEVFSSIYALSPGLLAMVKEFGPNSPSFKEVQNVKTQEDLKKTYYPKVLVAVARAWSPNPNKPPFYCDFPFSYEGDKMIVNQAILEKWEANMPVYMINKYADNLRKLTAIKLDWGRNDSPRFPVQIGMLSQRLENLGINHFSEEYIGDHGNKIWTTDGRVLNDLLPFFNDYLTF
ncbi:enterochelin esterase-like enzyme [Runella defluvii]|uniref:Enterochelin esterase-like enzyme n=1 Tax=Runella defluvii TaxID=370973 RepID=A0A7W5ZNE5_9BACT|nr:alpha/beta hydrolase-fold protein [Runella defluvii]MBB3840144.1 enterochelin esterase-like enzyme [Runella defluvii]